MCIIVEFDDINLGEEEVADVLAERVFDPEVAHRPLEDDVRVLVRVGGRVEAEELHLEPAHVAGQFRQLPVGPEPDLAGPGYEAATRQNLALAWASSPAAFIDNFSSPVLLQMRACPS